MQSVPIMPHSASNFADQFNPLFGALLALTIVFGGGALSTMVYFAVRYRTGSKAQRHRPQISTPAVEACLIGIPMVLGLCIFAWGARLYTAERTIPPNATEILVVGKQWMWQIYHHEGVREMDALTIPVGRPVRLTMVSQDVIHSFYVPAFRIQYYVLPGRYTAEWFVPTQIGSYLLLCNQYCGMNHSRMVGHVNVLSQSDYARWMSDQVKRTGIQSPSIVERAAGLFSKMQCGACHGAVDTAKAPTLNGLFGKARRLADGTSITADADYIRNAITKPEQFRLQGYPPSMPSYARLDERDVWALVKYVESK